jgi:hypothetical protein
MQVSTHVLVSAALAALLYPLIGWNTLVVFFFGFILDIDHPLFCFAKYREVSLASCLRRCEAMAKNRDVDELNRWLMVFHTVEFLGLLTILSFWSDFALYALIGTLIHMSLDTMQKIKTFNDLGQTSILWFYLRQPA